MGLIRIMPLIAPNRPVRQQKMRQNVLPQLKIANNFVKTDQKSYLGVVHILFNQYFGIFYPPPVIKRNHGKNPPLFDK